MGFTAVMLENAASLPTDRARLAQAAAEKLRGGWMQTVEGYQCHWQLRDRQHHEFEKMMLDPPAGSLCLHWDFQEPGILETRAVIIRPIVGGRKRRF